MDDVDVAPVDHYWCSDFQWITRHFSEYLEWVLDSKTHPVWWCRASIVNLGTCRDCMEQFHVLLDDELLNCSLTEKKRIFEFDTERLATALSESVSHLKQSIQKESSSSDVDNDDDDDICIMSQDVSVMQSNVRVPLREALSHPKYLHCKEVGRRVVEAISLLVIHDMAMNVKEKIPGVYLLLVHPVTEVQLWAVNKVKSLGLVTLDEYDGEVEKVVQWLLSVTKWGLLDPLADTDVPNVIGTTQPSEVWDEVSPTLLPSHLFSSSCPKSYWLGMCMLLKTLEGSIIRTKLSTSDKSSLISGVVGALKSSLSVDEGKKGNESSLTNTRLDKSSDASAQEVLSLYGGGQDELQSALLSSTAAFWPALQCFITLLERLEGQLWEHCSWSCKEVVTLITQNTHYVKEVRKLMSEGCIAVASADGTDGEPTSGSDTVSCSQLVYEWESVKRAKPKLSTNQRTHGTHEEVFQWLVPFVQSVVKYGSLPNCKKLDIFADLLSHLLYRYKEGVRLSGNNSDGFLDLYKLCNFSSKVLAYNFRIALILQQANLLSPVSSTHIHTTLDLAVMVAIGAANSAVLASPKMPFSADQPTCTTTYPECAVPACLLLSALFTKHEQCSNIVEMLGSLCSKVLAVSSHSVFAGYLTPRLLMVSSPQLSQTCSFTSPVLGGVDSITKLCNLGLKGLLARLHSALKLKGPTLHFNNSSYRVKPTLSTINTSGADITKRPLEDIQEALLPFSPHSSGEEVSDKPQLEDSYGSLSMTSTYALHFGGESPSLMSSGEEREGGRGLKGTQSTDDTEDMSGSDGELSGCARGSPVLFSDTDSLHSTETLPGDGVFDTEEPLQVIQRGITKSSATEYEKPTTSANRVSFKISRPPTTTSTLVTTKMAITTASHSTSTPFSTIGHRPSSKTVAVTGNLVTTASSSSLRMVVSNRSLGTTTATGNLATTTTATPTGLLATVTPTSSLVTSIAASSVVKPKSIPIPVIAGDSPPVALTKKTSSPVYHYKKLLTPSKPKRRRVMWSSESDDSDFEFSSVSPLKRKPVTQRKDTKIPHTNEVAVDANVSVTKKTPLKSFPRKIQTKSLLKRDLVIRQRELLSRIKSEEVEVVLHCLTTEQMLRANPPRKEVSSYPTLVPSHQYLCPPSTSSLPKCVTKCHRRESTTDSDDSLKEDELENLVKKYKDKVLRMPQNNCPSTRKGKIRSPPPTLSVKKKPQRLSQASKLQLAAKFLEESSDGSTDTLTPHQSGSDDDDSDFSLPKVKTSFSSLDDSSKKRVERFGGHKSMRKIAEKPKSPPQPQSPVFKLRREAQPYASKCGTFRSCFSRPTSEHDSTLSESDPPQRDILSLIDPTTDENIDGRDPQDGSVEGVEFLDKELNFSKDDLSNFDNFDDDVFMDTTAPRQNKTTSSKKSTLGEAYIWKENTDERLSHGGHHVEHFPLSSSVKVGVPSTDSPTPTNTANKTVSSSLHSARMSWPLSSSVEENDCHSVSMSTTTSRTTSSLSTRSLDTSRTSPFTTFSSDTRTPLPTTGSCVATKRPAPGIPLPTNSSSTSSSLGDSSHVAPDKNTPQPCLTLSVPKLDLDLQSKGKRITSTLSGDAVQKDTLFNIGMERTQSHSSNSRSESRNICDEPSLRDGREGKPLPSVNDVCTSPQPADDGRMKRKRSGSQCLPSVNFSPSGWSSEVVQRPSKSYKSRRMAKEPEMHSTHVAKQAQFSKTRTTDDKEDILCRIHRKNSLSIDSNPSESPTISSHDNIAQTTSSLKSANLSDRNRLRGSGVKRSPPPPLDWSTSDSSSNDEMTSKASNALSHLLKDKQLLSREISERQSVTEQRTVLPNLPTKVRKVSDPSKLPPVVSGAPFSRPRAAVFSENAPLPTTSKKARVNDKTSSSNFNFENILDAMKETKNDSSRPLPSDKQQQQQQSELRTRSVLSTPAPVDLTPRPLHSQEELLAMLLSWNADMFLSPQQSVDGKIIKPSPESVGISVHSLNNVPLSFTSVSGYFSTYAPLFLFELWESVYSEVHMPATKPPPFACKIEGISNNDGPLKDVRCQGNLSALAVRDYAYPLERDLVVVHIYEPGSACVGRDGDSWRVFGLVDKAKPGNLAGGTLLNITMKVHSDTLSYLREGAQLKVTVVMAMTTYLRQWSGLINVHKSKLAKQLLLPIGGRYFEGSVPRGSENTDGKERTHLLNGKIYNFSQHSAIQMAVRCACEPYTNPRINLLQGPPGTGKTRTIVGIIHHFFDSYKKHGTKLSAQRQCIPGVVDPREDKPHLLVCAPSNAGVDEIVNRLISEGLVEGTPQWKKRNEQVSTGVLKPRNSNAPENKMSVIDTKGLSVARVGKKSKIHNSVLPLSLDQLAEKKITEELAKKNKEEKALEQKLATLTKEAHGDGDSEHANKVKKLQWQLNALKKTRTNNRSQDSIMRRKILQSADIVFCTLSGSASTDMEGCFLGNPLHFTCIIVDEAAQCCELEVLIPLRYGSSKLVLVGDHLQLPATIRSQQAKSLGYDQSLFERIYKHFDKELGDESPVRMLQLQYRMVEEICHFPSQHFYHGELHSAQDVGKRGRPGLCPFLVFDVQGGKEESRERSSLCNASECSMVSELCRVVRGEVRENRIGVITPYKAQEKLLKQKLATQSQIEVGTVDSFQGREKDVIILSCVRAKAFDGSIGFLSDQKRMNVALTRAKFGLYIVCHKNTLSVNPTWRELFEHAETRNVYVTVPTGRGFQFYSTKILRPKQATATVSAPSCIEPNRSKTHSEPSASFKKDAHDSVSGVANCLPVCHKDSREHRPKGHSITEDGSCSHVEDDNHCHTESMEVNCQSKSAKEDDFHSREVGDNTGQSKGKGDNDGRSRGKGDIDGQSKGKWNKDGHFRGKGDNCGQSRGKGDIGGQSRGKGDNCGQSRGEVDMKGHSSGKGGRDHILSGVQSRKSDVDFAHPTSGSEVRNAMGASGISSRLRDSRSSTGDPDLGTNHLSKSHGPTQHKKQPLPSDPRRKTIPRSSQSGGRYAKQHSNHNSHTHHTRWENPSTTPLPAPSTRPSQYSHSAQTHIPAVGMPSPFVQQYSETSRHPIPAYSPSDKLWPRQPGQLSNLGFNPGRRDRVSYVNNRGNVPIRRPHCNIEQPAKIPRKRPPSTREIVLRSIHRKR